MPVPNPFFMSPSKLLLPLALFGAVTSASATLLLNESFALGGAPNYTVDASINNTGPTVLGMTGNWNSPAVAATVNAYPRSSGLSYEVLDVSGGALEHFRSSGSPSAKLWSRDTSYTMPQGTDLWGSFLFTYSSGAAFTFAFDYGSGNTSRPFTFALASNVLTGTPGGGSATSVTSGALTPGTTYMVLFQATDASGVYDNYTVWLNPTITQSEGALGTPIGTGTGVIRELSAVDGTAVGYQRVQFGASLATGQSFFLDEIRLGTSLGDIMPIPEPSSYGLLAGCFALGFIAWRRRR